MKMMVKWSPGVAKLGIALDLGSRDPEFESRRSDQNNNPHIFDVGVIILEACGRIIPNGGKPFLGFPQSPVLSANSLNTSHGCGGYFM